MIKYRAAWDKIEPYEVVKETEKQVVYVVEWCDKKSERREAKCSWDHKWFDTWEEAHTHLVDKAQKKVESLRMQLEQEKGREGQIRGMKKP